MTRLSTGEHRVEVVHRMTHLVETILPGVAQIARLVERVVLEEETDLVARLDEVAIVELLLAGGRKHAPRGLRIEAVHQLEGSCAQRIAGLFRDEILEYQYTRGGKRPDHLIGQAAARGRSVCG